VELFGFPVLAGDNSAVLEQLWQRYVQGLVTHIVTLNPEMVMLARTRQAAREALARGDVFVADGVGLEWAAVVLKRTGIRRYPGIDLVFDLAERLVQGGGSVYLLGSKPGVAEAAGERLRQQLPGLRLAGVHNGYFTEAEEAAVVGEIAASGASMVLAGMGCPRQEEFLVRNRGRLGAKLLIGVGGALEVFAGHKLRAPRWVRHSGIEWAYRTTQDVSRLRRLGVLPRFILMVLNMAWQGPRDSTA
jgi:N-acetylglucosaminyldiphosphoundecaprenol N-acetyl-beta-D-mannosaminyltransferase